ncbi:MAG: hypothetical protein IT384_28120 [Deltaproteobacteria bacterium]|nr:hypothetical protein [Deltaproteobacteria bacterium]
MDPKDKLGRHGQGERAYLHIPAGGAIVEFDHVLPGSYDLELVCEDSVGIARQRIEPAHRRRVELSEERMVKVSFAEH